MHWQFGVCQVRRGYNILLRLIQTILLRVIHTILLRAIHTILLRAIHTRRSALKIP